MISKNLDRWKTFFFPHGLLYSFLLVIIIVLIILTSVYSSLWRKTRLPSTVDNKLIGSPIRLPKSDRAIQWTLLQMNDVYELLPLDRGRKGGLARVATIRQLLRAENPHTYTILAGDLLFPSAIGVAKVNGTSISGRQMVLTMNALGLDMITFGNHEFDLTENDLLERMHESNFTWISSNVFRKNSSDLFGPSVSHRLITIDGVRVLFIGLTIDGTGAYVDIINQTSLVNYVDRFLKTFPNGTYDVLVALTHLDMATDIALTAKIPQIDLVLGGHEHENYYYLRGAKYTPIAKADANAFTVYIHRCMFDLNSRRFDVQSRLTRVTPDFPDEEKTAAVANYWFNLGIEGFEASGYHPGEVVACLPSGLDFDGRSEFVRSTVTELTAAICESVLHTTKAYQTTIGLINGGTVRVDDILRETITQYDILRTLPFANFIVALSVPGSILAQALTLGQALKGNGMYLAYVGVETPDAGQTWFADGVDIMKSGLEYRVATNDFFQNNSVLKNSNVTVLYSSAVLQAKAFMEYLKVKYPPC